MGPKIGQVSFRITFVQRLKIAGWALGSPSLQFNPRVDGGIYLDGWSTYRFPHPEIARFIYPYVIMMDINDEYMPHFSAFSESCILAQWKLQLTILRWGGVKVMVMFI